MITYTQGNLLEAKVDALVNTVNTVGVMGKGIALMFKERFPENFRLYEQACKAKQVHVGRVFATRVNELDGPQWIINFPTKQHWKPPSRLEWVIEGLRDLRRFLLENEIKAVAIPPLGAGNGGLEWPLVREQIEEILGDLPVAIQVFEPTTQYQNVAKRAGVEKLTPPRALIAELVRRYWVLGMQCSLLEIQKLAWFLEQAIVRLAPDNPLDLRFTADKYGPYAHRLTHLLNSLDGSYLHCDKRIADASPLDIVSFNDRKKDFVQAYLMSDDAKPYATALEEATQVIDGFESPFGMELLATVDWLVVRGGFARTVQGVQEGLRAWPAEGAGERKLRMFDERSISVALERLSGHWWPRTGDGGNDGGISA